MENECAVCGKTFHTQISRIDKGNGKYCSRHCSGIASSTNRKTNKCNAWKGGRSKMSGYVQILSRLHPRANVRGYVFEHVLIAENKLGRYLTEGEVVHHINGNRSDNNPDNLLVCPNNAEHHKLHRRERALKESGNPNAIKCKFCKAYDIAENMSISPHGYGVHKACNTNYYKERRVINE